MDVTLITIISSRSKSGEPVSNSQRFELLHLVFLKKDRKINIWISIKLQEEIEDKCDDVRDEAENGL